MPEDQVKIVPKSNSDDGYICCSDGMHYPYGTSISIRDEMIDELGVDALALGDVVEVRGYAFVNSKSEYSRKDEQSKNLDLQLTSLKLRREEDDAVKQLYGDQS